MKNKKKQKLQMMEDKVGQKVIGGRSSTNTKKMMPTSTVLAEPVAATNREGFTKTF